MPLKDQQQYNEYMNRKMQERYHKRRIFALRRLGRKCAKCGSTKKLDIDHINPEQKSFSISRMWSVSWERFVAELDKCQLLCKKCHKKKSAKEARRKVKHGAYYACYVLKCECSDCQQWKVGYNKKRRLVRVRG